MGLAGHPSGFWGRICGFAGPVSAGVPAGQLTGMARDWLVGTVIGCWAPNYCARSLLVMFRTLVALAHKWK